MISLLLPSCFLWLCAWKWEARTEKSLERFMRPMLSLRGGSLSLLLRGLADLGGNCTNSGGTGLFAVSKPLEAPEPGGACFVKFPSTTSRMSFELAILEWSEDETRLLHVDW